MAMIILLGLIWYYSGNPLQIHFTPNDLLPDFSNKSIWVALTGVILSFCGIEIATVHAADVENPQRNFPRALLYSVAIIVFTLIMGSLAIAMVLPHEKISLVSGIMQASDHFFAAYHLPWWCTPALAFMLILGGLGAMSNWIISPTKGLLIAAQDGNLPPALQKINKHGAPSTLLIYQAILVTILSSVFLLLPTVNASYWLLTVLAAQTYMFMYLMMFAAAIYLRFFDTNRDCPFQVPGGKLGLTIVSALGIIGTTATICVGFIPPQDIYTGSQWQYEIFLLLGLAILSVPPFITYKLKKPEWALA
jgi:glutamate:GABA antiporter